MFAYISVDVYLSVEREKIKNNLKMTQGKVWTTHY